MNMKVDSQLSLSEQDIFWMEYALTLAKKAEQEGEVPVGAVIVSEGILLSEGWNQTIQLNDATAHAEIIAIRAAGKALNNYRLPGLTMYVTLEPCPMCSGALVHARLKRIVIAARDLRTGCAGSLLNLLQHDKLNHSVNTTFDVLGGASSRLISSFFKQRRAEKKATKALKND